MGKLSGTVTRQHVEYLFGVKSCWRTRTYANHIGVVTEHRSVTIHCVKA